MTKHKPTAHNPAPEFIANIAAALHYWEQLLEAVDVGDSRIYGARDNLFRAVQFGLALPATQLAAAELTAKAFPFVHEYGYWEEWLPAVEAAVRVCPEDELALRFRLLTRLGQMRRLNHQLAQSLHAHEQALALAAKHGGSLEVGEGHYNLARAHRDARQYEQAEKHAKEALKVLGEGTDNAQSIIALTLNSLGLVARARGDLAAALDYLQRSVAIWRQRQDTRRLADGLHDLGNTLRAAQQYEAALACYHEASRLLEGSAGIMKRIILQYNIGVLHFVRDDWAAAETIFRQIDLPYLRETGNVPFETNILTAIGNAVLYQQRYDEAAGYLRQAVALWRNLEDDLELANALGSLGEALAGQGNEGEAIAVLDEALQLLQQFSDHARAAELRDLFTQERRKLGQSEKP